MLINMLQFSRKQLIERIKIMQSYYTAEKVNNEIELCEIKEEECKKVIEKAFLKNRISYFMRWKRTSFFNRHEVCIICVNETDKEAAEAVVKEVCDSTNFHVKFLMKKPAQSYL